MLDSLLNIVDFLRHITYSVYTLAESFKFCIDFLLYGIPYTHTFISSLALHPLFAAPMSALMGLGVLRFFWIGGD